MRQKRAEKALRLLSHKTQEMYQDLKQMKQVEDQLVSANLQHRTLASQLFSERVNWNMNKQ